jgi:hypothetical protein
MSKRDQLWGDLAHRNPRLLEDPHFTAAGLRRFFERVYDAGFNDGYSSAKEHSGLNTGADMFSQIFGGGFRR